jgi:hypothetical protein
VIWRSLQADPNRYICQAVRRGVIAETVRSDFVQKGMRDLPP